MEVAWKTERTFSIPSLHHNLSLKPFTTVNTKQGIKKTLNTKYSNMPKISPGGHPVSSINSVYIKYIHTRVIHLHLCAISVSSLCFLFTTQYVSHHRRFNVLVHVQVPVTGHGVFVGKLH